MSGSRGEVLKLNHGPTTYRTPSVLTACRGFPIGHACCHHHDQDYPALCFALIKCLLKAIKASLCPRFMFTLTIQKSKKTSPHIEKPLSCLRSGRPFASLLLILSSTHLNYDCMIPSIVLFGSHHISFKEHNSNK